jgi:hypothetical protein
MKNPFFMLLFIPFNLFIFMSACSRIEIQSPEQDGQNITTPYTLVVDHTGCGTVKPETFKAWLDKDGDNPEDISNAFSYSQDTWTATDYDLPMGNHTLSVQAGVNTGGWCRVGKARDERAFFVAPCTDFEPAWGENFEMAPDVLTIEYNGTVVEIGQGESKVISIPEGSPILVDGKLPATVSYGLNNLTDKNLKFRVVFRHGETVLYSKDLAFCGAGVVDESHQVLFSPSNEPITLIIEAGDILRSPTDDTRPIFYNAKLQVRIYPV